MTRSIYEHDFDRLTMRNISTDINSIAKSLARIQKKLDDLVETVGYLVPETVKDEETTHNE